jgi:hypothetical protein
MLAPKTIAKSKLMAAVDKKPAKESDKAGDKKASKKTEADPPADKGGKKKRK